MGDLVEVQEAVGPRRGRNCLHRVCPYLNNSRGVSKESLKLDGGVLTFAHDCGEEPLSAPKKNPQKNELSRSLHYIINPLWSQYHENS